MTSLKGKYFVTGKSLPHTLSPDIYTRLGLNYGVMEFPTEDAFIDWVKSYDYDGFNVTIPYKETILKALDYISPEGQEIGAVNTVIRKGDKLYGYNTDCYGISRAIRECGIEVNGKKVVVLGSGGTSKCAVYVMKKEGAKEVKVCSRRGAYTYSDLYNDKDIDVIINTTPVGMFPNVEDEAIDLVKLGNVEALYDVIYNPLTTSIVQKAKQLGIKSGNGLGMLVYQGVKAYELYTDTILEEKVAQMLYNDILADKQNIVIIGMPGAGKTTYGKRIAKQMNKEFYDTDEVFEVTYGIAPREVILESGEQTFREMETKVVASLSSKLGVVIATGGGAVLSEKNRNLLKANGKVLFIDRDINLLSSKGRPISQEKGVKKLYEEREGVYRDFADITIKTDATTIISQAVTDIIEIIK